MVVPVIGVGAVHDTSMAVVGLVEFWASVGRSGVVGARTSLTLILTSPPAVLPATVYRKVPV